MRRPGGASARRWVAVPLAVLVAASPLTVDLGAASGSDVFAVLVAAAKDGGGNSGSGSGNSGSGSDNSGSGSDDGDGGNSGHGGGDDGGGNSGPGGGGDHDGDDSGPGSSSSGRGGERIEISGADIEVIYRGGWKEEIHNGRLELKDPRGRTVVKRWATAEDVARMRALAR